MWFALGPYKSPDLICISEFGFLFSERGRAPHQISEKPLKSQLALFKGVTLPDHQTEVGLTARPLGVALKAQLQQAEAIRKLLTLVAENPGSSVVFRSGLPRARFCFSAVLCSVPHVVMPAPSWGVKSASSFPSSWKPAPSTRVATGLTGC